MRALLADGRGELAVEIPATDDAVLFEKPEAALREAPASRPLAPLPPQGCYALATARSGALAPGRAAPVGPTPRVRGASATA